MQRSKLPFILIILGLVVVIGGIGYGATTKKVTMLKFKQGTIAHYLSNGSNAGSNADDHFGYLQMENSADYFLVHEQDFTPAIHGTNTFQDGQIISFTYDPSDTTAIDAKSSQSHLQGSASSVVEIISFGDGGQTEYTTNLYRSNPGLTYNKSNWPVGLGIATGGAVLALLSLLRFSARRRMTQVRNKAVPRGPDQPYQAPAQPAQYGYGAQPAQYGYGAQPGYAPTPQPQQSQPGFYPPTPQPQPQQSQPGLYPPGQQSFPSQPGPYPPQQQPATQYPAYPPEQGQYDQTQQAPDPYNR